MFDQVTSRIFNFVLMSNPIHFSQHLNYSELDAQLLSISYQMIGLVFSPLLAYNKYQTLRKICIGMKFNKGIHVPKKTFHCLGHIQVVLIIHHASLCF